LWHGSRTPGYAPERLCAALRATDAIYQERDAVAADEQFVRCNRAVEISATGLEWVFQEAKAEYILSHRGFDFAD
jgi:hypothetical protein